MPPLTLSPKHQDLLKAYFTISKPSNPDWTVIATKADFATPKYARDQFALVKSKLLATASGEPIDLSDRQIALLKVTVEGMKAETDWEAVARAANVKTPKYARDQWAIVRNKLCGGGGGGKSKGDAGSPAKTPKPSKTTGKTTQSRKRKKRLEEEDGEAQRNSASANEDEAKVPTPKSKKTKTHKIKVEKTEEVQVEDELDEQDSTAPALLPKQTDGEVELEREINFFEDASFGTEVFHVE